jgi:PhoH-like ATPase
LCGTVLQELDKHKDDEGERGYNARESLRKIKSLIKDALSKAKTSEERLDIIRKTGIDLPNGGKLFFEPDGVSQDNLPAGYSLDRADNRIISSCVHMNNDYLKDSPVTLLTNDGGCYINSLVCGVNAEEVRNDQINNTYTGHINLEIEDWSIIESLHKQNDIDVSIVKELNDIELYENMFITMTSGSTSVLSVYTNGKIHKINDKILHNGVKPLNKMQHYAMWALTNPNIPLVILEGPAGTSKTFLSLACGLEQVDVGDKKSEEPYGRMLIARPNAKTSDADFGYLPGTLEEKMGPLVASYMDNLEEILGDKNTPISTTRQIIEDMMYNRIIELCPLYSIRGRSIHNAYLICDEAQNASKKLIKDVITRAGRNTKIIVAGDPRQIDNTSLDVHNNGLVYLKDCMKGSSNCAILRFENENCVRSVLAEDAINRMK